MIPETPNAPHSDNNHETSTRRILMQRRTKAVVIRFTEDEWKALNDKVKMSKMPRERFCRVILLGAKVNAPPDADYLTLIDEVRRVGINLNQLIRVAYVLPNHIDNQRIEFVLRDVHAVSDLLCETFRKVAK